MQSKFFDRSELTRSLYHFRREFLWVGIFSMIANLLMLSPSLYMMQVFDRVLISHSELTLIFLTIIIAIFFCVMALSEWLRSRLWVRVRDTKREGMEEVYARVKKMAEGAAAFVRFKDEGRYD